MQKTVSVVHLVWVPYGIELFKKFVESYRSHPAGAPHILVLLFNGSTNKEETNPYHLYIQQTNTPYKFFYYPQGQDLEAYRWIANQLTSEYLFFVNSFSRFRANDWLHKFLRVYTPGIGIVGATGSWQSHYSSVFEKNNWSWSKNLTFRKNFDKYKLLIKALFFWRYYFAPFPNPHIRTNSFFVSRLLFADLNYENPKTKFDAYRIESGRQSITQQILNKGLDVLVIDKFGQPHRSHEWYAIKVFWSGNQENTLIADNQTEIYDNAPTKQKQILSYTAWHYLT